MTAAQSETIVVDMPALLEEMKRYLETVALFRAEGCEPHWATDEPHAVARRRATELRQPARRRVARQGCPTGGETARWPVGAYGGPSPTILSADARAARRPQQLAREVQPADPARGDRAALRHVAGDRSRRLGRRGRIVAGLPGRPRRPAEDRPRLPAPPQRAHRPRDRRSSRSRTTSSPAPGPIRPCWCWPASPASPGC